MFISLIFSADFLIEPPFHSNKHFYCILVFQSQIIIVKPWGDSRTEGDSRASGGGARRLGAQT